MNIIRKIFIHEDGYLRTTLQILIAAFIFLIVATVGKDLIARGLYELVQSKVLSADIYDSYFLTGVLPETFVNFMSGLLILGTYKLINKKPISSIGVTSISKDYGFIFKGIATLMVMLSCITLVLVFVGDIKFTGLKFNISILQYILLMSSVSFVEEVLNRGFIQHVVKSRLSKIWSLIIPSIVFTLFHVVNPGITVLSIFNIFLAGIFFSLITNKVGNIWFAFGAHIVWNVGAACIFGLMDVSSATGTILNFEYIKYTLFNGYGAGPLSGVIGSIAWLSAILLFSKIKMKKSNQ